MSIRETLASNFRAKREKAGLSRKQLAALSKVALRTISKIETGHGNCTIDTLAQLAKVLGTTTSELLNEHAAATPSPKRIRTGLQESIRITRDLLRRLERINNGK